MPKPTHDTSMTVEEIKALPVIIDVKTAARALGLGRTLAGQMVRSGTFPVPVLMLGRRYRFRRADLLAYLRIEG